MLNGKISLQNEAINTERAALGVYPMDDDYSRVWLAPYRTQYYIPYGLLDNMDIFVSDAEGKEVKVNEAIKAAFIGPEPKAPPSYWHELPDRIRQIHDEALKICGRGHGTALSRWGQPDLLRMVVEGMVENAVSIAKEALDIAKELEGYMGKSAK